MSPSSSPREKIPVGILGATGAVGQRFIAMLENHPWFTLTALAASERSAGKPYGEVARWTLDTPLPPAYASMIVQRCEPPLPCAIVFSALDAQVAGDIEEQFARAGCLVVSKARNHRMRPDVPLLLAEVNAEHRSLLARQPYESGGIVTDPNCSVSGLCMALKPLIDRWGVEQVQVTTLQAISGAGYPGVASLDIVDNIIPFIGGEEEKVETEPLKIFGSLGAKGVEFSPMVVSAQCNRVPVIDGHTACVSVKLASKATPEEIVLAWETFRGLPQERNLPTAPSHPILYFREESLPQPRRQRMLGGGMTVSIGRLRRCPLLDYKFVVLSHNTIRGAAGGGILNAELLQSDRFASS